MIVSWNWLKEYVPLEMDVAELEQRLAMAGLNHESTEQVGDDLAIDLEVTSNRPDCLGHLGVAREVSVLWDLPLIAARSAAAGRRSRRIATDQGHDRVPRAVLSLHGSRDPRREDRAEPRMAGRRLRTLGLDRSTTWWISATT